MRDYAVGALYPDSDTAQGRHLVVVEFEPESPVPDPARFAALFDATLQGDNDDYRAHRSGDYGVALPEILIGKRGIFAAWMKSRGKLGGQNKVPRILTDPALFADLRAFVADRRA